MNTRLSDESATRGVAVVTGASSGIGEATARVLAAAGFSVVAGARRKDRLDRLADEIGCLALELDVADHLSVESFCAEVPEVRVLVNNAGGARGLDSVGDAADSDWMTMYESNVLGTVRMTRALLPKLEASGDGHIVIVTSIAGFEVYPGGGGYTAAKHAESAVARTLRMELLGMPIRVTDIAPGMVETEFSVVRFRGDAKRARKVYEGMQPLEAADVADCVLWAVTRPSHVNVDKIVVMPRQQAGARLVAAPHPRERRWGKAP